MGGDTSTSKDEGDRGIVVTSVERHEPMAASISGERDTKKRCDILESRKRAASEDTTIEREAKWARSSHPLEESFAPQPLLQVWWGTPAGHRSMFVPLHLWGQRVCVTHNGGMPCQWLQWVRHELAVVAIRGSIGNRPGRLLPRSIRGGTGRDP